MTGITRGAAELLNAARAAEGIPDFYGLRLYGETHQDGSPGVGIAFTEGPAEGDRVIEEAPLPLYVAPEVEQELGDIVVDVEGETSGPRIVLRAP